MSDGSPTVGKYIKVWLTIRRESKSYHTFLTSTNAAKAFIEAIGNIPLPSLSEDHYSAFLSYLKQYDPKTEQVYASLIFSFFEYLDAKNIKHFNMSSIRYSRRNEQRKPGKRLRKVDIDSISHFRRMLNGYATGKKDLSTARAKAMFTLALDTGLRVSELCKLHIRDIDLEKRSGRVIGKGDKERPFKYTDLSVSAIRHYLNMRKRLEPDRGKDLSTAEIPLFVSHSKRGHSKLLPLDTDAARDDLRSLIDLLIGETRYPVTPHVIRHFFANELRKKTSDLEIVRAKLGHSNISTTQGYMHVSDDELNDILEWRK